jgi:hypothetical protein
MFNSLPHWLTSVDVARRFSLPVEPGDHLPGDTDELADLRERHVPFVDELSNRRRTIGGNGLLEFAERRRRSKARLSTAARHEVVDDVDEIGAGEPFSASTGETLEQLLDRLEQLLCCPLDSVDRLDIQVVTHQFPNRLGIAGCSSTGPADRQQR